MSNPDYIIFFFFAHVKSSQYCIPLLAMRICMYVDGKITPFMSLFSDSQTANEDSHWYYEANDSKNETFSM